MLKHFNFAVPPTVLRHTLCNTCLLFSVVVVLCSHNKFPYYLTNEIHYLNFVHLKHLCDPPFRVWHCWACWEGTRHRLHLQTCLPRRICALVSRLHQCHRQVTHQSKDGPLGNMDCSQWPEGGLLKWALQLFPDEHPVWQIHHGYCGSESEQDGQREQGEQGCITRTYENTLVFFSLTCSHNEIMQWAKSSTLWNVKRLQGEVMINTDKQWDLSTLSNTQVSNCFSRCA